MAITDDIFKQYRQSGKTQREFAFQIGVNPHTFRRELQEYLSDHSEIYFGTEPMTFTETDEGVVASVSGETVKTLEDLIRVCAIDLNIWQIDHYEVKSYQGYRRDERKHLSFDDGKITGTVEDDGELTLVTMYAVKAWLSRREDYPIFQALESLLDRVGDLAKPPKLPAPAPTLGDHLFVPGFYDIHFNRLDLTRAYTLERAQAELLAVNDILLARALRSGMGIGEILFPVGNDILNTDNYHSATTKGTRQDNTASQPDAFEAAATVMPKMILSYRQIAPVKVAIVSGNHDRYSAYALGKYLEAFFSAYDDVTIDNGTSPRKYHRYGVNLIGMEHGDEVKARDLPAIMAEEAADLWAKDQYRVILRGHFHKEFGMFAPTVGAKGLTIYTHPAFCPPNLWEQLMGFVGNRRAAEGRFFHREHGPSAVMPVFVDEALP